MRGGAAGFTLIEAVIVLALMALGVSMLGPILHRGTSARDLDALVNRVALAARRARTESMRSNGETALLFDASSRSFLVRPGQASVALPPDVTATLTTSRAMADGERPAIRFLPNGRSSGGEIRFAAGSAAARLTVDWLTGWPRRVAF